MSLEDIQKQDHHHVGHRHHSISTDLSNGTATMKGKFAWVRKLMNNRNGDEKHREPDLDTQSSDSSRNYNGNESVISKGTTLYTPSYSEEQSMMTGDERYSTNTSLRSIKSGKTGRNGEIGRNADLGSMMSGTEASMTSDAFSTKPLYSVHGSELDVGTIDEKEPEDEDNDYPSIANVTSETSGDECPQYTAESVKTNPSLAREQGSSPRQLAQSINGSMLDASSVVTLASSTKNWSSRLSVDTNASTTAIPPASILERIKGTSAGASLKSGVRADQGSEMSG